MAATEGTSLGRFLLTPEVASLFRTSPDTVRYWRSIGYGPDSIKVGRRVLYRESDVQAFLSEQGLNSDGAA